MADTQTQVIKANMCAYEFEYLLVWAAEQLRIYEVEQTGMLKFVGYVDKRGQFSVYCEKCTIDVGVLTAALVHIRDCTLI